MTMIKLFFSALFVLFLIIALNGQESPNAKYTAYGFRMNLGEFSISNKIGKPLGGLGNDAMMT